MLSLTNPFRGQRQSQMNAVSLGPPLSSTATAPSNAPPSQITTTARPPWLADQKLSSMLSACEAGTHEFSRDDYVDNGRRPSSGESCSSHVREGPLLNLKCEIRGAWVVHVARLYNVGSPVTNLRRAALNDSSKIHRLAAEQNQYGAL